MKVLILIAPVLCGCSSRDHGDDLWRAVGHCEKGYCK